MSKQLTREEWYADYQDYREAYGYKNASYNFIRCFLNWCSKTYPDNPYLTQEMLDIWRERRSTENEISHSARVSYINKFLVYINQRSDQSLPLYSEPMKRITREPVLISKEQITNFFRAVDELPYNPNNKYTDAYLRALQLPVLFRLQYSTGMRPNEVRWLNREDIDLDKGLVYLRRTKGYHERMLALHPSMLELLKSYWTQIHKLQPYSRPLFPNLNGQYRSSYWLRYNFNELWYRYNPRPPKGEREVVSYALRHNYAIENIMKWHQDGYNADKRLVALSRSMGHVSIRATQYYFHLVPRFADLLEDAEGDFVNKIMPEV